MRYLIRLLLASTFMLLPFSLSATASGIPELVKISDRVYAIVGDTGNRTPQNFGNNATFGFIVTTDGVVVIDTGGSYNGAEQLHTFIKGVTDKPVKMVINTGGQDHRWMGNGYFKALGAEIVASSKAVADQKNRSGEQLAMLRSLVGDKEMEGTLPTYADRTFGHELRLIVGETAIEIHHAGQAHTPGDAFVWLPKEKIVFSGDIVYMDRMPGILGHSSSKSWIGAYEAIAVCKPEIVVPGHGRPAGLDKAKRDTFNYLVFLRGAVAEFMKQGGEISEIRKIDQSRFNYLQNHETLSGNNAWRVYEELEWE